MKFKILVPLALSAFVLSGCLQGLGRDTYTVVPSNEASPHSIDKMLNLPQNITFEKQSYALGHKSSMNAEYFLDGERGFGWTKLITISYGHGVYDMEGWLSAMEHELEKQKSSGAKNEYKFEKLSDKKAISTEIFYPTNNPNLNKFEANLKIYEIKDCGAVNVHYAMNFDKDTPIDTVRKQIQSKKANFLKNYPRIECAQDLSIKSSKLNHPQNLEYMQTNFEKFKEYPRVYGSDTSAVTYFSAQNPTYGQIDVLFSEGLKKKDFDKFLSDTKKDIAKFDKKHEAKIEKLAENKALQTMLWYPNQRRGEKDYEMNFAIIELKSCGMTQTIYKQRLLANSGSEDEVKNLFGKTKTYFLANYPKLSCK
ncbi:MAG: hypothetical protein J6M14_07060 [Campylobacter sp.]|nr:hypothetical protein [Campylobacter sp.]